MLYHSLSEYPGYSKIALWDTNKNALFWIIHSYAPIRKTIYLVVNLPRVFCVESHPGIFSDDEIETLIEPSIIALPMQHRSGISVKFGRIFL